MPFSNSSERLASALARAHQHWHGPGSPEAAGPSPTYFTVALSREAGTFGALVARAVGDRLGWPVYDSELLQRIADDLGVRRTLLESVDERRVGWLNQALESFASVPRVSEVKFVHHLLQTLLSLAAHGNCVIVGRGAVKVLPWATTLRVRVVAPLAYRVEAVAREHGISADEAARRVESTDHERRLFVQQHFQMDPEDPRNYDLILNAARFDVQECTDLVIAALDRVRKPRRSPATPPVGAAAGA
jgi:cytidylate kinase